MSWAKGPEYYISSIQKTLYNLNTANISLGSTAIFHLSSIAYPNLLFSIRDETGSLGPSTSITFSTTNGVFFYSSMSSFSLYKPYDSVLLTNNTPYWTLQNTYAYKTPGEILETYISTSQLNTDSLIAGNISTSSINYSLTSYSTIFCSSINGLQFPADITNLFLSTLTFKPDLTFNLQSNLNSTGQVFGSATLTNGICFLPRYPNSGDLLFFIQRTSKNSSATLGDLSYSFINFYDANTIPNWGLLVYSSNSSGIVTTDQSSFDWLYFNKKTNDSLPATPVIVMSPSNIPSYTTDYPPVIEKNYFQFGNYAWSADYDWTLTRFADYFDFGPKVFNLNTVGFSFKTKLAWFQMKEGFPAGTLFDFTTNGGLNRVYCSNDNGTGNLKFGYYNSIGMPYVVSYDDTTTINSYLVTTISGTYDPNVGFGGEIKLWINGSNVLTESMADKGVDTTYSNTFVGKSENLPLVGLQARIYYFAAYNRVLTEEEAALVL
jgi:hypothetical protein